MDLEDHEACQYAAEEILFVLGQYLKSVDPTVNMQKFTFTSLAVSYIQFMKLLVTIHYTILYT